jgi:hypothetical protein
MYNIKRIIRKFFNLEDINADSITDGQGVVYDSGTEKMIPADIVPEWGNITGTLSDQADLQSELDDKLESGDNISDLTNDSGYITTITGSNHSQLTLDDGTNPHSTTQSDVGLGNVDNTSDLNKPISTATQSALDDKVSTSGDETIDGTLKVGDIDSGDYTEIESDGTIKFVGDATVWDDLSASLIGRRLFATAGTVDYDYDENAVTFDEEGDITDANDRVGFSRQYPHKAIYGTGAVLKPHLHFEQDRTDNVTFTLRYRIQSNNTTKTTSWTTITADYSSDLIFTYPGSGTFNNILAFPGIDMSSASISATIDLQFTRTDSLGGDLVYGKFFDLHCPFDTAGSREEYVK